MLVRTGETHSLTTEQARLLPILSGCPTSPLATHSPARDCAHLLACPCHPLPFWFSSPDQPLSVCAWQTLGMGAVTSCTALGWPGWCFTASRRIALTHSLSLEHVGFEHLLAAALLEVSRKLSLPSAFRAGALPPSARYARSIGGATRPLTALPRTFSARSLAHTDRRVSVVSTLGRRVICASVRRIASGVEPRVWAA